MKTLIPGRTLIKDCKIVPIGANSDARGCLYEIFKESWEDSFHAVQWNACVSNKGVLRGVHVHLDYYEFYTLPKGKVIIGLSDIRQDSPSFGRSISFKWLDTDGLAIIVPMGVAHAVYFEEDSVLAFGLSGYWKAELDILGCQWNDPKLGFDWPIDEPARSFRDVNSCSYDEMILDFEKKRKVFVK